MPTQLVPMAMLAVLTREQRAMVAQALSRLGQGERVAFLASLGEVLADRAFVGDGELWRFLRDSRQVIAGTKARR
jgi:hypothetical protein